MASYLITSPVQVASHLPSPEVALSGVFGSISLVAWICVILPQLITNFKAKSADGLSMVFLTVWLFGDVTNLVGAVLTHLAPTAIILPSYFVLADMVLVAQCVYYNRLNKRRAVLQQGQHEGAEPHEDSPLLRRSSSCRPGDAEEAVAKTKSDEAMLQVTTNPWVRNTLTLIAVFVVGTASWFITFSTGAWNVDDDPSPEVPSDKATPLEIFGLVMGYVSAVCYLCARVPQIIKNYREKSCEGLALLFFMLSLTGNLTYGISLVAYSQETKYLLAALPFLIGSVGTIVEDCIIFVQFRLYADGKRPQPA